MLSSVVLRENPAEELATTFLLFLLREPPGAVVETGLLEPVL